MEFRPPHEPMAFEPHGVIMQVLLVLLAVERAVVTPLSALLKPLPTASVTKRIEKTLFIYCVLSLTDYLVSNICVGLRYLFYRIAFCIVHDQSG